MHKPAASWTLWGRRPADFFLFAVTAVELAILVRLTPGLTITDWVYICSHVLVLGLALTRRPHQVQDRSIAAGAAVFVSYTYSYAQVILLEHHPGREEWPDGGMVLVLIGAVFSLTGLISLGRFFGARPAMRGLATKGTYRLVRHPLYLAYVIQDIGYNLYEWSIGTLILVAVGWASMIYRIRAEERMLAHHPDWMRYSGQVRYRLVPGIW